MQFLKQNQINVISRQTLNRGKKKRNTSDKNSFLFYYNLRFSLFLLRELLPLYKADYWNNTLNFYLTLKSKGSLLRRLNKVFFILEKLKKMGFF